MFETSRSLQLRVGFFVLLGFAILGGMAVYFGRLAMDCGNIIRFTWNFPMRAA